LASFLSVIPVTDVVIGDRGLEVHYDMEKLTGPPKVMADRPSAQHREGMLTAVAGKTLRSPLPA